MNVKKTLTLRYGNKKDGYDSHRHSVIILNQTQNNSTNSIVWSSCPKLLFIILTYSSLPFFRIHRFIAFVSTIKKKKKIDDFKADLVKHPDEKVHSVIADIYNTTAETGDLPREINTWMLLALRKYTPKKTSKPCDNLRPIIMLSILRKILTTTLLKRIWYQIAENKIIKEKNPYQPFA